MKRRFVKSEVLTNIPGYAQIYKKHRVILKPY